jgi:hypothetical protein
MPFDKSIGRRCTKNRRHASCTSAHWASSAAETAFGAVGKAACTGISSGLEMDATGLDRCIEQGEVALDGRHRAAIPLPERGTPLDVCEEEGDGPGREIRHGLLETFGWTWFCSIVA